MSVYFSGTPLAVSTLKPALDLIAASPGGKFKLNEAWLSTCKFYLKPPTNEFHTTRLREIFLGSNWYSISVFDQASGLLHESAHSIDQVHVGFAPWLAAYLISPWNRLDKELGSLSMEVQWGLVNHHLTPVGFFSYAQRAAQAYQNDYKLWPISTQSIQNKILNLINIQYRIIQGLK